MVDGIEEEYLRGKLRKLFALMGLSKSEVSSSHPSVYYKAADHTPSLVDEFKDLLATHGTADGTGTGTSHCEDGKTLGSSASTPAVMPAVTGPIGPVGPPAKTASPTTSEAEAAPAPTMSAAAPGPAGPAGPAMPAHLMKGSSGAEASVQTNNDQDGASGHTNSRGRREENSREGDGASNDDDASVSSKRAPKGPYKPSADEIKEIMRQREEKEKEEREEEMGFGPIIPGTLVDCYNVNACVNASILYSFKLGCRYAHVYYTIHARSRTNALCRSAFMYAYLHTCTYTRAHMHTHN